MVSFLTRLFGTDRLNLAEDVVQDTLCQALQVWSIHGPPANPSAWLMRAARNRAIDLIRRDNQLRYITADLAYLMKLREDHARAGPGSDEEAEAERLVTELFPNGLLGLARVVPLVEQQVHGLVDRLQPRGGVGCVGHFDERA